ncbi:MAG: hypothetical protein ACOC98_11430 [Thermodesulfobacteriota bacterium]
MIQIMRGLIVRKKGKSGFFQRFDFLFQIVDFLLVFIGFVSLGLDLFLLFFPGTGRDRRRAKERWERSWPATEETRETKPPGQLHPKQPQLRHQSTFSWENILL